MLTAERIDRNVGATRMLYKLSEPVTVKRSYEVSEVDHVTLSLGRMGDTCVFLSDDQGRLLDLVGFGYAMGPSRWLTDDEFDGYVAECIAQHLSDDGAGLAIYPMEEVAL